MTRIETSAALAALTLLLGAAPAFAEGAYSSPPSPNSASSEPESPNSVPQGGRTLPANSTGVQRLGTIGNTRVQPAPARAPAVPR